MAAAAAAAEKIYGRRKTAEKNAAGHHPAVKIIRPSPDFCPAVEFDTAGALGFILGSYGAT